MATRALDPAATAAQTPAAPSPSATTGGAPATRKGYLFGPVVDFLCLGGSSLILLPLILLLPLDGHRAGVAWAMMLVAHAINHPHFAHSYQIFYRGFGPKAFTPALGREMQLRYLFAGIAVPALLLGFFAYGIAAADTRLLGYGANLMGLAVGWHYVKQGYGMLMVDAALKRRFFDDQTKKVLLVNCYAVWVAAWLQFNHIASERDHWGIAHYTFDIPQIIVTASAVAALSAGAITLWALIDHARRKGRPPVNGLIAYVASLYMWLLFVRVDPVWALMVPALHSLQYLVVVWRFQLNYEKAQLADPSYKAGSIARRLMGSKASRHFGLWALGGGILGFLGFWGLPIAAAAFLPFYREVLPITLFLFVFGVFINVHHYFLDNVMWRRGNPDTRRYLFG